jgi:hypothetical protein
MATCKPKSKSFSLTNSAIQTDSIQSVQVIQDKPIEFIINTNQLKQNDTTMNRGYWAKLSTATCSKDSDDVFKNLLCSRVCFTSDQLFCVVSENENNQSSFHFANEYGYVLRVKDQEQLVSVAHDKSDQPYIRFHTNDLKTWKPTSIHSAHQVVQLSEVNEQNKKEDQFMNNAIVGTDKFNYVHIQWGDQIKKLMFCTAPYVYIRYKHEICILHTENIKQVIDMGSELKMDDTLPLIETILFNQSLCIDKVAQELFEYLYYHVPYQQFTQKGIWERMVESYLNTQIIFYNTSKDEKQTWSCENKHLK